MVKALLNVGAVLPAAGVGDRFGEKKQLKHLANKPLFIYALDVLIRTQGSRARVQGSWFKGARHKS